MKITIKQYQKINEVLKKAYDNASGDNGEIDYINHKDKAEFYDFIVKKIKSYGLCLENDKDKIGLYKLDKSKIKWAD